MSKPPSFLVAKRAGAETARYAPAEPALWLQHCAAAGIEVVARSRGIGLIYDQRGPNCEQGVFLVAWLYSTPGAIEAVLALLDERAKRRANAAGTQEEANELHSR